MKCSYNLSNMIGTFLRQMRRIFFEQKKLSDVKNDYNLDNGFACAYKRSNNYLYLALIKDSFFIPMKTRGTS